MSADGKEALGLTEHHQNQIRELLRYNRFKRSERLVGIELCFKDFIETRLYDDETYTQDEVGFPASIWSSGVVNMSATFFSK